MAVRVPHAPSGLFAGMAEVTAMSESAFRKRFQSSYEISPSVSPPDLPSWKRYRGTSELVKDSDDEEDEEIEESMNSNSMSKDAEDEGPTAEDKDPAMEDKDDEGHSVESDGLGLEEEEDVPGGQQQAALVVGTTVSAPLGLGYGALRHHELALEEGDVYSMFEVRQGSGPALESEIPERTPPSPEWTSGLLLISPSHSDISSPISSPIVPLTIPSPVATHATAETKGFLAKLGAQVEMHGGLISDHAVQLEELSPTLFKRSLEYEQERVALAEERLARLELVEVVDGTRRGQEPKGGGALFLQAQVAALEEGTGSEKKMRIFLPE
ncbi:reverse transcriptase domain-containing protein, chloroplastic [Tanacetum coccineum]